MRSLLALDPIVRQTRCRRFRACAYAAYSWPGNIRELQNLIERAVIRSTSEQLNVPVAELEASMNAPATGGPHGTLVEAERAPIHRTLNETGWIISGPRGAARRLGLNRTTLQFRMKKLGIERPRAQAVETTGAGRD
jgi:formate hydrogenlyase transcriptional activator